MQADGVALAIKTAYRRQSISGMLEKRSSLQAKAASRAIGLSLTTLGCLQAMDLPPMEPGPNDVPQAGTSWFLCSTDGCCRHPTINSVRVKGLPRLALGFLEPILVSQFFGLVPLFQVDM